MKERKESWNNFKRAMDKMHNQMLKELDDLIAKTGKKGMSLSDCLAFMENRQDELMNSTLFPRAEFLKIIPPRPTEVTPKKEQDDADRE